MTMHEPTTAITDFILALMSFYFGHMLFHVHSKHNHRKEKKNSLDKRFNQFWSVGFVFLGIASLMGGLAHGFPHLKGQFALIGRAWPFTVMSMGVVSFYLLLALAVEYFPRTRNAIFFLAYFKLMIFMLLMFGYPQPYFGPFEQVSFSLVIYDYAPILIMLLVMNFIDFMKTERGSEKRTAARTMVVAILVSILGTLVQMSGFKIHENFNHNDLYHVIQMVAIYLMYRSVTLKRILQ